MRHDGTFDAYYLNDDGELVYDFKLDPRFNLLVSGKTSDPKYREQAARIVQGWWRERKEKNEKILEQIIKIQSAYRGRFTRKYVFDIVYISYLYQKFYHFFDYLKNYYLILNYYILNHFFSLYAHMLLI